MWRIKALSCGPHRPGDPKTEDSALKHTSHSASKQDTERWGCEAGPEIKNHAGNSELTAEWTACFKHIWRSGLFSNEQINRANSN